MAHKKIDLPVLLEDKNCLPEYSSVAASGADIRARLQEPMVLNSGASTLVPTGIRFEIPVGYEIQVRPRSGLALKNQLTVLNTPGTIDADYRGELSVILINHGKEPFTILPGMRIAQIVLTPVVQANFIVANALSDSARGVGGFGHTGTH